MYAVIKTGGKQHKVQAGDVIEVEKLVGADETVTFTPLLVVDDDGKTHAGPAASIIVRQRGTKIHPGDGVGKGGDDTLFATREGVVDYRQSRGRRYATVTAAPA